MGLGATRNAVQKLGKLERVHTSAYAHTVLIVQTMVSNVMGAMINSDTSTNLIFAATWRVASRNQLSFMLEQYCRRIAMLYESNAPRDDIAVALRSYADELEFCSTRVW